MGSLSKPRGSDNYVLEYLGSYISNVRSIAISVRGTLGPI